LGVRGGDDDSGGAHGKHLFGFVFAGFVRSREVTPSLGSARLHPRLRPQGRRSATFPEMMSEIIGK
jgi:hypothetical protein